MHLTLWSLDWHRLLSVENSHKNGKTSLFMVFEYIDTDLRRFMDLSWPGPDNPLPQNTIKVSKHLTSHELVHCDYLRNYMRDQCLIPLLHIAQSWTTVSNHILIEGILPPFSPEWAQSFMFQLLKGVAHCHSHGIMHRYRSDEVVPNFKIRQGMDFRLPSRLRMHWSLSKPFVRRIIV